MFDNSHVSVLFRRLLESIYSTDFEHLTHKLLWTVRLVFRCRIYRVCPSWKCFFYYCLVKLSPSPPGWEMWPFVSLGSVWSSCLWITPLQHGNLFQVHTDVMGSEPWDTQTLQKQRSLLECFVVTWCSNWLWTKITFAICARQGGMVLN